MNSICRLLREVFCFKFWVIGIRIVREEDRLYKTAVANIIPEYTILREADNITVADPYLVACGEDVFLCFERQDLRIHGSRKGDLRCIRVTPEFDMDLSQAGIILEEPYHLSYPYIFERDGRTYMIPESGQNREVRLYTCESFPGEFRYVKTLIKSNSADTNLLKLSSGEELLFTYTEGRLEVYCAEHFDDRYKAIYRANPSLKHRGAGNIIEETGRLIRPVQDCSEGYGGALEFRDIQPEKVDAFVTESQHFWQEHDPDKEVENQNFEQGHNPNKKAEDILEGTLIKSVKPSNVRIKDGLYKPWQIGGIHTYNALREYEVVDLLIYRFELLAFYYNVSRALKKRIRNLLRRNHE